MKPTGYRVSHKETGEYYAGWRFRHSSGINGDCGKIYGTPVTAHRNGIKWRGDLDEPEKWEIVEFYSQRADGEVVEL